MLRIRSHAGLQRLILRTVYQNNPTMKVKVEQAIAMARNNESLEGLLIEDLQDTQVRAVDAAAPSNIYAPKTNQP